MGATITKVALRRRAITNGRESLYLDFYPAIRDPQTMKMTRREYLGIYVYTKPRSEMEKEFNHEMQTKAEVIRSMREHIIYYLKQYLIRKSDPILHYHS